MAYNPAIPNAYDTTLIPREVRAQYFEEVLLQSNFSNFMGDSDESVIQVLYKKNGTGTTTTFAFSQDLDYTQEVTGYGQITGTGQDLKFFEDEITVGLRTRSAKLQGLQIVQLNTPIDVFNALKPKLQRAHKRNIIYSLLKSATYDSYSADFAAGPVVDRVQYGTDTTLGSNWNASMIAAADTLTGNAHNNGGLSVNAIKNMRRMAMLGGVSYEKEKRISPYEQRTRNGFPNPMYVYFMSPSSYKSLEADPQWNQFYNRGIIEMPNQPSGLNGSLFRGQIDGVLIYETQELERFTLTPAQGFLNNRSYAWNLFCGAQAFGLVWHKEPWFAQELSNMQTEIQMSMLEFRGEKSIKFPSFTNPAVSIENGIIHHIVRLTA